MLFRLCGFLAKAHPKGINNVRCSRIMNRYVYLFLMGDNA
jgi:hypothetical protein